MPTRITFLSVSLALMPFIAGCGGGEAEPEPTITVKSAQSDSGAGGTPNGDSKDGPTAEASGFGTLTGRVVFQGTPPDLPPLHREGANIKDADVCAAQDMPNERLVVGPEGGVANVFIYLPRTPSGAPETPAPEEPAIFDQEFCRFKPHAMVLRAQQPLEIRSSDGIAHNTNIVTKLANSFNQVITEDNKEGFTHVFGRAESAPVQVRCDIHSWMSAYLLPLDHPYAAVTQEDGTFRIENLPAGSHRFRVWHEGAQGNYLNRSLTVEIKPDEETSVTIDYPQDTFAAGAPTTGKSVKLSSLAGGK